MKKSHNYSTCIGNTGHPLFQKQQKGLMREMNKPLLAVLSVLVIVTIACGSSSTPQVNTPSNSSVSQPASPTTAGPQVGTARSNPAPVGSEVVADDMAFMVMEVVRPANEAVKAGNSFNSDPKPEMEYMLVKLQVTCKKTSDEKCSIFPDMNNKLIGDKGIEYDPEFVTGVEGELEATDFYGGATVSGYIPFMVGIGEGGLSLVYDPLFGDKFFLQLP